MVVPGKSQVGAFWGNGRSGMQGPMGRTRAALVIRGVETVDVCRSWHVRVATVVDVVKLLVIKRSLCGPCEVDPTLLEAQGCHPPRWSASKPERGHPAAKGLSTSKP